jgi:hypothetical protein
MSNEIPAKIEFIQFHQPPLKDGEYRIELTQGIAAEGKIPADAAKDFRTGKTFYVAGHRFHLDPRDVFAVFPPAHSLGEHSNVLPHILLNRSTLPWERMAGTGDEQTPWLALLLIDESESGQIATPIVTLADLKSGSKSSPYFPGLSLEKGQRETDKLMVIDIEKELLEKIVPGKKSLQYLTHVRQGKDSAGNVMGEERAVIICNRLPQQGKSSTVYLVSLENRYTDGGFNYQTAGSGDKIRLVTLKSWQFTCLHHDHNFSNLLKNLDRNPSTLRLQETTIQEAEKDEVKEAKKEANKYLKMGCVPAPHYMRNGSRTVSWYHGPLTTGQVTAGISLPVQASDRLLRYYETNGMFDISYASAWELGRLLALRDKSFSTSLYRWKRTHVQSLRKAEQVITHDSGHLPGTAGTDPETPDLPEVVKNWFDDLRHLKGVPFNYLVPDERMLPVESIRFFYVDRYWMECLLDGAFSIGRVIDHDHQRDVDTRKTHSQHFEHTELSGFLLRSEAVSGWPGLQVDGYKSKPAGNDESPIPDPEKLPLTRMERLSKNVLICLFAGGLQTVDIHLKPETLHFGLTAGNGGYFKELRDTSGQEQSANKITISLNPNRTIDIAGLVAGIQDLYNSKTDKTQIDWIGTPTSAEFALQMIEGVQKVRFITSG